MEGQSEGNQNRDGQKKGLNKCLDHVSKHQDINPCKKRGGGGGVYYIQLVHVAEHCLIPISDMYSWRYPMNMMKSNQTKSIANIPISHCHFVGHRQSFVNTDTKTTDKISIGTSIQF